MHGWPVSRILSRQLPALDDHSSAPALADGIQLPTRASRAEASLRRYRPAFAVRPAPREAPIRHCSGRGLPCHSCYQDRGGLLPHRFTITLVAPAATGIRAVSSLLRFPSGYPGRELPGALASWSPDFPRCKTLSRPAPRSSGHPCAPGTMPRPGQGQRQNVARHAQSADRPPPVAPVPCRETAAGTPGANPHPPPPDHSRKQEDAL